MYPGFAARELCWHRVVGKSFNGRCAALIGFTTAIVCAFLEDLNSWTRIDDSLDVFKLLDIGGLVGSLFTHIFATPSCKVCSSDNDNFSNPYPVRRHPQQPTSYHTVMVGPPFLPWQFFIVCVCLLVCL